jgi:hypothetical protein
MMLRTPFLASMALFACSACQVTPEARLEHWLEPSTELAVINPNTVAVLGIEDRTEGGTLGELAVEDPAAGGSTKDFLSAVRYEIGMALIGRDYAPLAAATVDRLMTPGPRQGVSVVEAGYLSTVASKANEDAVLAIQITRWGEETLLADNRVNVAATVCMLGSRDRKVLWSGSVSGQVEAGGVFKPAPRVPVARRRAAIREFAQQLLAHLPPRRD